MAHRDQVGGDLFNGLGDGPVGSGKGHAGTSNAGWPGWDKLAQDKRYFGIGQNENHRA
ncbi:protein of unknown function [Stenotrophomonas maltophilia]|nr:protein of unknown function [Stenotrophomonas maltophilia]